MDIIYLLTYLHIQQWFSWNVFLLGSTIFLIVVGKWIFDSFFAHFLTKENLDYCYINEDEKRNELLQKSIENNFFLKENNERFLQKQKLIARVW